MPRLFPLVPMVLACALLACTEHSDSPAADAAGNMSAPSPAANQTDADTAAAASAETGSATSPEADNPGTQSLSLPEGQAELLNGPWELQALIDADGVQQRPAPTQPFTLVFLLDSRVGGQVNCNRYQGRYQLEAQTLTFSPLATTRMACPEAQWDQPFLERLQAVTHYRVAGDQLRLLTASGAQLLFRRHSAGPAPTDASLAEVRVYQCEGDAGKQTVTVLPRQERLLLWWQDSAIEAPRSLTPVPAASGSQYQAGDLLFWDQGDSARLQQGEQTATCQLDRAAESWARAWLRGVTFRGLGNEPGWELLLSESLTFRYDYGQEQLTVPLPTPSRTGNTRSYRTETAKGPLTVTLVKQPCRDSMRGDRFPVQVTITLGDQQFRGCGRSLP